MSEIEITCDVDGEKMRVPRELLQQLYALPECTYEIADKYKIVHVKDTPQRRIYLRGTLGAVYMTHEQLLDYLAPEQTSTKLEQLVGAVRKAREGLTRAQQTVTAATSALYDAEQDLLAWARGEE